MNKAQYIEDLKDIRDIMNRSTRFISLSGMSGIFAGIVALGAAYAAYETVYSNQDYLEYRRAILTWSTILKIVLIAGLTLVLSIGGGIYFTLAKVKKKNQKIWDQNVRNMLSNLFIPLIIGGILCFMLLYKGYIAFVAPFTLIFYGIALINASKFTLPEIKTLGILESILGLVAFQYIGYGLIFWSIGFGVLHIVFGIIMYYKYDR